MKKHIITTGIMITAPIFISISCSSKDTTDQSKLKSYVSINFNKQNTNELLVDIVVNEDTLGGDTSNTYKTLSEYAVNQISEIIKNKYMEDNFAGLMIKLNSFAIKTISNSTISLQDIKDTLSSHFS